MAVSGMNHFTILTDNVEATTAFYGELLGLEPGERPPFTFPGAWLYAGGQPILHVIGGRPQDELRPGVIDHMAFSAEGLGPMLKKLHARGIHYDCRRLPGDGTWQVFFFDPNGARVELDFVASEAGPAP
jgi:catechol 2,3-dioxygenase-like lactoylglutathione lyase family enzyme